MDVLLAFAADVDFSSGNIISLLTAISSIGFAVWYGYHVTSSTLPKMVVDHQAAMVEIVARQAADMEKTRQEFRQALDKVVEHCSDEMDRVEKMVSEFKRQ